MKKTKMNDTWLKPLLAKRSPDAMRVLCDLLEAGLRKGECSANDIRDIQLEQPNIIGGVFKIIKKFGFIHTERREVMKRKKRHGGRVDVWELADRSKAENAVTKLRSILLGAVPKQIQQELYNVNQLD